MADLTILTCEEVLRIHEALCADFADGTDPIAPSGVKSQALLESAISRQNTGAHKVRKHPDAVSNAATVTYGLCNDHPFHNGNKRTALVSMLAHLDKNHLTLVDTKQEDLFEMILSLANHQMSTRPARPQGRRRIASTGRGTPDQEVAALTNWLRPRTKVVSRGERQITYRQLRPILRRHGYELEQKQGNSADVIRVGERKKGLIRRETVEERKKIGTIGYHSGGEAVAMKTIKEIRRITGLTEEDGRDSDGFYGDAEHFDVFINQYRTILRRLARR